MKKITFIMVIITLLLSFGMTVFQNPLLANTENNKEELRDKYLNIITVSKPQADMVKAIVKDKHNIQYMFTEEQDIQEFIITKESVDNVSNMDLFLYSGVNFEPWMDEFIEKLKKGGIGIINLARGIRITSYELDGKTVENPYYFDGIEEYQIALSNVKNCIQDKDPKNRDYYEKNYNEAVNTLNKQLKNAKNNIKYLKEYTFLTFDSRFDYLLDDLGINYMNLNNEYINNFIDKNNLDADKVIIIQDGANEIDLNEWIDNHNLNNNKEESSLEVTPDDYKIIKLWKYYGDMGFNELILYNVNEISHFALSEKEQDEAALNTLEKNQHEDL